jgi:hypothetical protein
MVSTENKDSNRYTRIGIDGVWIDFCIEYDFTVPCSHCGATCTGTYLLWYVRDGKRISLETNTLDIIIDRIVNANLDYNDYEALPVFFQHWNECIGWCDEANGAILDREDLLRAVDLMEAAKDKDIDPELLVNTLDGIRKLIDESISVDSQVWMMTT